MEKLNLSNCKLNDFISVDKNDCFDPDAMGKYGYRVFYDLPVDEIKNSGYFTEKQMMPDDKNQSLCGGQIEFTVNRKGSQVGEILLWMSFEDEEGNVENTDFVDISDDEDISVLVDDFAKKIRCRDCAYLAEGENREWLCTNCEYEEDEKDVTEIEYCENWD